MIGIPKASRPGHRTRRSGGCFPISGPGTRVPNGRVCGVASAGGVVLSIWISLLSLSGCEHVAPASRDEASPVDIRVRREQSYALLPIVAAIEEKYQKEHQVEGMTFVSRVRSAGGSPRYATDSDNAIFTGMYLAAASYRYAVTRTASDLAAVESALGGVYLLTHVSGIPGVLARWAFPLEHAWDWIHYDRIKSLEADNGWGQLIDAGQLYEHNGYAFHTRTTRDQLTGIVMGLSVAHSAVDVPKVRMRIAEIVADLIARLRATGWSLEDQTGATGTNAHRLDPPLRLALEALHHATLVSPSERPSSRFFKSVGLHTAYYNRHITRTFAWNLHAMNAHTLVLLSDHHLEERGVRRWERRIWRFLAADDNPHFAAMHFAWRAEPMPELAWKNLQRRAADNYYKFFSWERDPDAWWHGVESTEGPGLDVLLPYWMQRYYDAHPQSSRDHRELPGSRQ